MYQEGDLPPLANAHTYVLNGEKLSDGGCRYDYPALIAATVGSALEARDIAIDVARCRKLVEEGVPVEIDAAAPLGDGQVVMQIPDGPAQAIGDAGGGSAAGYNWTWWEDGAQLKVNQDKTSITFAYEPGCSGAGTTVGEWHWLYGTGWFIQSYSGSESESCTYYRGETTSWFQNNDFCGFPYTKTFYYYVRTFGYPNGGVTGTRSTISYNDCLPLWEHHQVRKTS